MLAGRRDANEAIMEAKPAALSLSLSLDLLAAAATGPRIKCAHAQAKLQITLPDVPF